MQSKTFNMKKVIDFTIKETSKIGSNYSLLKVTPTDGSALCDIYPGQFVQVEVPNSKTTFLRRPISVNYVDAKSNQLWLLIRNAGAGTNSLIGMQEGERVSIVFPLGRSFSVPNDKNKKLLLVGGGVGVAPLYFLASQLHTEGYNVNFLVGARSAKDLLEIELFEKVTNKVFISTEDGSIGEKGLVTHNSALSNPWDMIYCCGPMPMMKAVASYANKNSIECEVSLENKMACGIGACLCCVEDTDKGNECVCTTGPVFNIKQLKWEI